MIVVVFIFGLIVGSFLNVCICRIPIKESIVFGRSHCMNCGKQIKSYDLIPLLSFVFLKGRCRSCGAKISIKYPLVELLNALIYLFLFLEYGLKADYTDFILFAAFFSVIIIIAFVDFEKRIIPDNLVLIIIFIGIFSLIFSHQALWYEKIIGFFAASVPLFLASLISKGGMGGGDIKLMAASGLFLGYKLTLISLLAACIIGSVYGIVAAPKKKEALKSYIPFGPFLSIAMCLSIFFGNYIVNLYINTFFKF